MNPNITLTEIAPDEFEVTLRSRLLGVVWMDEDGDWAVEDTRGGDDGYRFASLGDAVDYLIG